MSASNQYQAMASFMKPPPSYYQATMGPFQPPPGPSPNRHHNASNHFNLAVQPPPPSRQQQAPPPPQQSQRIFPTSFTLYHISSAMSFLDPDSLKFTLGTDPKQPLYGAKLETDALQRPKLTLVPAWDKKLPPLASIKTKGWKDSMITVEPPPGSIQQPLVEKLTLKYGASSRMYSFGVAVPSHAVGRRETFAWRRAGSGGSGKKSKLDKWGLGSLTDMDMGLGNDSMQTKRELVHEGSNEVVAVWTEDGGSSMTKTGQFEFVGCVASGVYGPQWEIMVVISVLQIWHEDYHAAKSVMDALGGA